ncbi:MAG: hypothetical protein ACKON7_10540, partial [Planctomycetaceae bacterium]
GRRPRRKAAAAVAAAEHDTAALAAAVAELAARLADCERVARGSHTDADTLRRRLDEATATLDTRRQERLRLEAAEEAAAARVAELRRDADAAREAVDAARLHSARLAESQAAWEGNMDALAGRLGEVDRHVEVLEADLHEKSEAVQAAWRELAGWKATLEACRERRDLLRDLVERHDGLSDAARRLLAAGTAGVPGLAGALADLIEARVEWAALVDIALGGRGQSLVVESLADAIRWHADWADTPQGREVLDAGGRIGFVAAAAAAPRDYDPSGADGVVGRLDRLVAADMARTAPAAALLERLLGCVLVVDRIDQALPLVVAATADTVFLARSGDCLTADGVFEIGVPAASAGLVARRAELTALDARHAELTATTAAATARIEALEAEVKTLRTGLAQAAERRREAAAAIASSRVELDRVLRERHAAETAATTADRALKAAEHRAAAAAGDRHAAGQVLASSAAAFTAATDEVAAARSAIEAVERNRGAIVEEIQRLRIEQATAAEKLDRCRAATATAAAELAARDRDVEAVRADVREAEARRAAHELELLAAGAAHAEAVAAAERSLS